MLPCGVEGVMGLIPGWGPQILPAACGMAKKKKKIRNNIEKIMDQPYLNVLVFKMSIEFILAIISKLFEDNFYDSHLSKN